jgi:translation initiation factor 1
MAKDWKERLGVVYSTNSDFQYDRKEGSVEETLPLNRQKLTVSLDKKNRKGKSVTLVSGFVGSEADLKALGKVLKSGCGVGGTVKEGVILIQGDFRVRAMDLLKAAGYQVKRSGGR